MPELPEVEVVRRGVHEVFVGRRISAVQVHHGRAVRRHAGGPADFSARLVGRDIVDTDRRGKYLWLRLDDARALVVHLGMSGQLRANPDSPDDARPVHLRVRIRFDSGGTSLDFVDQRTFGGCFVSETPLTGPVPLELRRLARDPLDPGFDSDHVVRAIAASRTEVKRQLLDQTRVSGIGNIYADEALWRARVHWAARGDQLDPHRIRELLDCAGSVMRAALEAGGTSFDALYVDVNGASGAFGRKLAAYGRAGLPCYRCGDLLVRERFDGRSSYRCPSCQTLSR